MSDDELHFRVGKATADLKIAKQKVAVLSQDLAEITDLLGDLAGEIMLFVRNPKEQDRIHKAEALLRKLSPEQLLVLMKRLDTESQRVTISQQIIGPV